MIEVLVVDDDFMVARIHTGFVERTPGFTVTGVAHTGAEALAAAERLQPDLVLLDVYLPDLSGLDLLGALREAAPEVDVLVISAAREADTVRRALRGGIVHYLMKPFSYDDLRVRLEHYQQAYAAMAGEQTDQADVDRVFSVTRTDRRLPKGFSAETLRLVEDTLRRETADVSAAEAASLLGISRVSARRYL
ncbi:MAG TPA: response regulator, partial [Nocardioidaceae bacterium]|nr:response regulator [Nocardioidaceae bacterium]